MEGDNNLKYTLENVKSFELTDIFECGQCFRWNVQEDGSYIGIVDNAVIEVRKIGQDVVFESNDIDNLEELVTKYFDLDRDYEKIKQTLSNIDDNLAKSISYGAGIRLLNQNLWETIISFITSANNNIPRIKKIIETLARTYGKEIEFKGKTYYTFPKPEEMAVATVEDFRKAGLGFRDKYVYKVVQMVQSGRLNLNALEQMKETSKIREELLKLPGVGEKVADCILLFSSLKRLEVFPIDVWVRRVMNELYIQEEDEAKVDKKQIQKLAYEKYKDLAGIAQQYLFYWKRGA